MQGRLQKEKASQEWHTCAGDLLDGVARAGVDHVQLAALLGVDPLVVD